MLRRLEFGISVDPSADSADLALDLARRADESGLDLLGIQDHPYQRRFLDTWMLMATILARTERLRVFPDVANLPLRGPAMLAKQAASLDVLSGGRFELGLGAGGFWDAIAAMGGPRRSPREALESLEEAIHVIRAFWSGERSIDFDGRYYSVRGLHPGPPPAHRIEIWIGAYKPRMLELVGRLADGWIPSLPYLPPEEVPDSQARVDDAARTAGRDPPDVRRAYNLMGEIDDVAAWTERLSAFVTELRFDTLVFWPGGEEPRRQLDLYAQEIVPALRERAAAQPPGFSSRTMNASSAE
jgi:alkanesulfonate monooxygenase SsuD/methylene tetrahydromethanopterin reductase-like flavin-dependent oxidoreductase (luciferase family)